VNLAARIGGEIVNADSMQVYRGMDIGSAKPSPEQRERVPVHLIDIRNPDEPFSAAEWKLAAETAIGDIAERGKRAIVCGGTGMYVRALLDNWSMAGVAADPEIRAALTREAEQIGLASLHERLARLDPATAARLHPNDALRIIRALEVIAVTGTPISQHAHEDEPHRAARPAIRIGLTMERARLYERIDARVESMIAAGFETEVRHLMDAGYPPTLRSMQSLGYKQMTEFITGACTLVEAIDVMKRETRRFAKRQLTWFRADSAIRWVDATGIGPAELAERLATEIDLETA
jgi:tRNA dimethylallyltransferase